jgi:phosphoserine phosphatase
MSLAIFDLDNTLLADDSDYLWGQFLVDQKIVDADYYAQENERFYQEYKQGQLDILEFLNFSLKPLADNTLEDLLKTAPKDNHYHQQAGYYQDRR